MKRLALAAVLSLMSYSALALSSDPIDQRLNREKPTSPIKLGMLDTSVNEFDPSAPDALEVLAAYDNAYRTATGVDTQSANLGLAETQVAGCFRASCHIFANVVKNERPQMLYLYIDGQLATAWKVSTAAYPHTTPNFDGHPAGPFYPGAYTSRKYPEGDYHGLGNMPYATFYSGGFAIHGTPSIGRLGVPASHGCVRSHPDNAHYFSQLVRAAGGLNVWVTVSGSRISPYANPMLSAN
jgi:lipoprotein-anchoring transpeptidase ErfK/SrfK